MADPMLDRIDPWERPEYEPFGDEDVCSCLVRMVNAGGIVCDQCERTDNELDKKAP